jgi:hypothetical protein
LKTPPLAAYRREAGLARAVGDVLAEDDDAGVALHLVLQAVVQQVDHGARLAAELRRRFEAGRGRVDFGGIDVQRHGGRVRLRRLQGEGRRLVHFAVDLLAHRGEELLGRHLLPHQRRGEVRDRVAGRVGLALGVGAVQPLVVRQRVRVGADGVGVHQGRAAVLRPDPGDRPRQRVVRGDRIAAVHFLDPQAGEVAHQTRDVPAGSLRLDRHRDGVLVVGDQEQHRRFAQGGGVDRLPELPLAGRAVAAGDVGDGVGGRVGHPPRLGAADRLQELAAGRARLRHDVELRVAPVARHLPPARGRVGGGADPLQEHLARRHPELQAEGAVAVIGVEPVLARPQQQAGGGQHRLVAGAADLEVDPVLPLELDLLVVDPARQVHRPVDADQFLPAEA